MARGSRAGTLRLAAVLAAVSVGVVAGGNAGAQPSGNDWPQYVHDQGASGFSNETLITPTNLGSLQPKPGWAAKLTNGAACPSVQDLCSNAIPTQPTVATVNGTRLVYVGSWNGSEYALCASSCSVAGKTYTSGQVVWSTYLGRTSGCGGPTDSDLNGVTSAAAVIKATVNGVARTLVITGGGGDISFAGTVLSPANSQLFALDALSGAVVWRISLGAAPSYYIWSSPVAANNSLYLGISSQGDCPLIRGKVVRLDPSTGQVLNTFATVPSGCLGGSVWGSASVDPSGNVYVATGNSGSCKTGPEPYGQALLKLSSKLSLLSAWQVPVVERDPDPDFGSTPTLFTGTVTPGGTPRSLVGVANKNGIYYVFDRGSIGAGPLVRLTIAAGGEDPSLGDGSISPSAWGGHWLYIAGGNTTIRGTAYPGSIRAFDPNNLAAPLWETGLASGSVLGAVSIVPGVAVVSAGSSVVGIRTSSGARSWTRAEAGRFYGAASIAYGVLYIGDTTGHVRAYSVNGQ